MPYKDTNKRKEHLVLWRNKNREWFKSLKTTLKCKICGEDRVPCLDFHHRDFSEKDMNISRYISSWKIERILKEIAKCDILCSNCHRILHWEVKTNGICN